MNPSVSQGGSRKGGVLSFLSGLGDSRHHTSPRNGWKRGFYAERFGLQLQGLFCLSWNAAPNFMHGECINGRFGLSDIASKRLSTGQFAFLSARHTAAGLKELPGEALHLAGGLQFAGFPSVIATMWGISNDDAPIVASHTYEYLFRIGLQGCNPSDAATALNYAIHRLREDSNLTVDRWASFIHFGT
ncbi:hypothetical protein PILCRDRAFT_310965 [Piloderma croceum F 1598]|uniref:CHAT domain-containing protein n=1 Tax=Piloderma croceum (strain F 1598) TaxID=765440 RepID=A0A0C3G7M8_PILCF|nr:hypothetical protein PILCRDRAFT_310965 [Piloderma croceum F 1598]